MKEFTVDLFVEQVHNYKEDQFGEDHPHRDKDIAKFSICTGKEGHIMTANTISPLGSFKPGDIYEVTFKRRKRAELTAEQAKKLSEDIQRAQAADELAAKIAKEEKEKSDAAKLIESTQPNG